MGARRRSSCAIPGPSPDARLARTIVTLRWGHFAAVSAATETSSLHDFSTAVLLPPPSQGHTQAAYAALCPFLVHYAVLHTAEQLHALL